MPEIPAPVQKIITLCEQIAAGEAAADLLGEQFIKARQAVAFERAGFERFSWDVIRTERIKELLQKSAQELDAHEEALRELESASESGDMFALEKAGRDLKFSAIAVSEIWEAMGQEAGGQEVLSPYPVYDKLLKVGQNILAGHIREAVLGSFFPPAANFTVRLRAATKRFVLFYGKSSLSDCAERVMTNVEAGMGAVDEFLRSGDRKALDDAMHLLVTTTVTMYTVMADMGIWAANERKYGHHPITEELFRAREANMEAEDLQILWQAVKASLQLELTQVQTLLAHPLGTLFNVPRDVLKAGMAGALSAVKKGEEEGWESVDLEKLDLLLPNLDRIIRDCFGRINIECSLASGASNFEELMVICGLAADGKVDAEEFRVILQETADNISEVRSSMGASLGHLSAENWKLLDHCLDIQESGCAELDAWCGNGDIEALRRGWQLISQTLPSVKRISREMKESMGVGTSAAKTVLCMRCGETNPQSEKRCAKCGAPLMQLVESGPAEYMDLEDGSIDGGSGEADVPANIVKLESLVQAVESELAGPAEVSETVGELLRTAQSFRTVYDKKVKSAASRDGIDSGLIEAFEEAMNTYIEGLEICLHFSEEPNIEYLYRGLEQCTAAAAAISDVQFELSQYF